MKIIAAAICLFVAGFLFGCCAVTGKITDPVKGTMFEFSYYRLWGEKWQKVEVTAPGGWHVAVTGLDVDAPVDPATLKLMLDAYLSTTGSTL